MGMDELLESLNRPEVSVTVLNREYVKLNYFEKDSITAITLTKQQAEDLAVGLVKAADKIV